MPARLARIGFGDKSSSLYEAVKMLTGLDHLSDIADGCIQFTHRGRRFLKYGKDNGLDRWDAKFTEAMAKAIQLADELHSPLPEKRALDSKTIVSDLNLVAARASSQAATHLTTLKSDIAPVLDTTTVGGRSMIRSAVAKARVIVDQGTKKHSTLQGLESTN